MMQSLSECKRIGILGGTFNPIHNGHLFMAEYAREACSLDKVLFIPTGVSYMKKAADILPGEERMRMLELSIESNPYFEVSDIELKRLGNTYTFETLEALKSQYPASELFFIVGADCLFTIANWYKPKRIFANCTLLAAGRNHATQETLEEKKKYLEKEFQAHIILLDFPTMDISSTTIRENVYCEKSIRYMVPEKVYDYIYEKGFYQR